MRYAEDSDCLSPDPHLIVPCLDPPSFGPVPNDGGLASCQGLIYRQQYLRYDSISDGGR